MYLVEEERCTGCGICLSFCERGAVSMSRDVAVIDQQRCVGCGGCCDACLQNAIYESSKSRRTPSVCRPMYGIESPFPAPPPGPLPVEKRPALLNKLKGTARRRRS